MELGTVSSLAAAAISVCSLGATLWVRWWDHPTADLVLASKTIPSLSREGARDIAKFAGMDPARVVKFVAIANDGDGIAHRVMFDGDWVDVALTVSEDPRDERAPIPWRGYPRLAPGDVVMVFVWPKEPSAEAGLLHARWRTSPTRHRRDAECWIDLTSPPPQGKLPARRLSSLMSRIRG